MYSCSPLTMVWLEMKLGYDNDCGAFIEITVGNIETQTRTQTKSNKFQTHLRRHLLHNFWRVFFVFYIFLVFCVFRYSNTFPQLKTTNKQIGVRT
jgi:hypothetical protein